MAERWAEFNTECLGTLPHPLEPDVVVAMRDVFYCGALAAIESLAAGRTVIEVFTELEEYKMGGKT